VDRRSFLLTSLAGALAAPVAVEAQEPASRTRIAFVGAETPSTNQHFLEAFRDGLRGYGYADGQNIILEARWAEGRSERFPELIGELIRLKARVIVVVSAPAALAAKNATTTIPIVFIAGDPLGSGVVPSLARPGGNLTGLSISLGEDFSGKWLELLKETVPTISRVAVLWNPTNPANAAYLTVLRGVAQKLGVKLQPTEIRDPGGFATAFASMNAEHAQALVVVIDPLTVRYRERIAELAAKHRLPAMYGFREFADAGGLMAYGTNVADLCRRAAAYVDKILKGVKPGDLPIEQATKFELVINLKTAKAIGLTIPPSLLARADQIIE
jgi:putative tryptophan/tyrosine transport system substrate-binding protein